MLHEAPGDAGGDWTGLNLATVVKTHVSDTSE